MTRSRIDRSEQALTDLARQGDVAAFEALVRASDARMRLLAFRMLGSRTAMDDALQDAYVRAFRAMPAFRGDARFSTWLHRIVVSACIDLGRGVQRRREDELPDEPRPVGGGPADPAGDAVAGRLHLRLALERLDPDQRAALLLVDGEGLSYAEAGEVLGVPSGTVSSRLSRARIAMRSMLSIEPTEGGAR